MAQWFRIGAGAFQTAASMARVPLRLVVDRAGGTDNGAGGAGVVASGKSLTTDSPIFAGDDPQLLGLVVPRRDASSRTSWPTASGSRRATLLPRIGPQPLTRIRLIKRALLEWYGSVAGGLIRTCGRCSGGPHQVKEASCQFC